MTQEVSVARKALTAIILAVALFAAVVIQLTVVNRLPLPGAAEPDLVLLLVGAIAVATGPATGAIAGFAGGLALDIAPPAAHYAGEYALVFCLVGYAAARVVRALWDTTGEHDPVVTFTVMAIAVAAGEAGKAAVGMLLSNPDVTTAAVRSVLPAAILYDLLLSPLVYWLVIRVTRGAVGWRAALERAPAPEFGALRTASVFRQASAGAAPNLRLAGTGESYGSPSPARRVPKLRLSGARSSASLRTTAAGSPGAPLLPLAGGRVPRLNFAGDRASPAARAPRPSTRTPGKNWLRSPASPAVPAAKRAVHSPSRGWLRAAQWRRPGGRAYERAHGRAPAQVRERDRRHRARREFPPRRASGPVGGGSPGRPVGPVRPVRTVRRGNAPGPPAFSVPWLAPRLRLGRAGVFPAAPLAAQRLARRRQPPAHRHRLRRGRPRRDVPA